MMTEENLDDYLLAYKSATDQPASRRLMDDILAIPGQLFQKNSPSGENLWRWFDLMMPKAVGWALTACFGIYMGISSPESGVNPVDEEYYLYDQAQILLFEDLARDLNREDAG